MLVFTGIKLHKSKTYKVTNLLMTPIYPEIILIFTVDEMKLKISNTIILTKVKIKLSILQIWVNVA